MPNAPDEPSHWRPFVKGNPFRDEEGNNPFGDDAPSRPLDQRSDEPPADEGPYAASATGPDAYRPGEFESTGTPRGTTVFVLGLLGLLGSVGGSSLGGFYYLGGTFAPPCVLCLPLPLFCLAITLPAWRMGRNDLMAMSVGALPAGQRKRTQLGSRMGAIGTLISVLYVVLSAMRIYVWEM